MFANMLVPRRISNTMQRKFAKIWSLNASDKKTLKNLAARPKVESNLSSSLKKHPEHHLQDLAETKFACKEATLVPVNSPNHRSHQSR